MFEIKYMLITSKPKDRSIYLFVEYFFTAFNLFFSINKNSSSIVVSFSVALQFKDHRLLEHRERTLYLQNYRKVAFIVNYNILHLLVNV